MAGMLVSGKAWGWVGYLLAAVLAIFLFNQVFALIKGSSSAA